MSGTRRQFVTSSISVLAAAALSRRSFGAPKSLGRSLSVRSLGAAGDGVTDDTKAFDRAFNQADEILVPTGTYLVQQIRIPAGKRVVTDGLSTVFRQKNGMASQTPIVLVTGSNVEIGSFSAEGNIGSDVGEWMHAISILADDRAGDLSDIRIGDVVGKNLRGDVLYLGARSGRTLSRVTAGNISGDNIYRNVVSITGTGAQGGEIAINSVAGTRIGLFHFDIEPEIVPVVGVTVGSIKGRNVSVSGQSGSGAVSRVTLGDIDLNGSDPGASVADPINAEFVRPHAFQQRNATEVSIGNFRARGFDGQAMLFVEGAAPTMTLDIKSCDIEDCSRNDPRNALIVGQRDISKLQIEQLRVVVPDNKIAMLFCDSSNIRAVDAILGSRAALLGYSSGSVIIAPKISGYDSILALATTDTLFWGGSAPMTTVGYSCDHLRFEDMTVSGQFQGGSTAQRHELTRTVLNNVYYEHEMLAPLQNA